MDHVVLDANAVGVDPPLGKLAHRLLFDAHRGGKIVLVVPELSLLEAVNSWKGLLKRQSDKLRSVRQELQKLVPTYEWTLSALDRDQAAERLHLGLVETLHAATVAMPKSPEVRHDELIARALARRQPFDERGSGYRDSLLWQIVCDYESQGHRVALLSNDCGAFAEGRTKGMPLAHVLEDELSGNGQVILFATLSEAIEELGLVQADALDATRATVDRIGAVFPSLLLAQVTDSLDHPVHRWVTRHVVNPFLDSSASLGAPQEPLGVEVREARHMDDGQLEASVDLTVRQRASVVVPAPTSPQLVSLGRLFAVDENYDGVELDLVVTHRCRVVLDPMTDRIVSAEALQAIEAGLDRQAHD